MKKTEVTDRRYPIGRFEYGKQYSIDDTRKHIHYLAEFPNDLKKTVKKLGKGELDMTYRKGGWTARQVVHHLADSHLNAYVRTKLAITEQTPIIKPYEQGLWAETEDAKGASVKPSLRLIASLHRRWVEFLSSLSEDDLERGYFHPETGRVVSIQECIALYAWHSRHHLAHIKLVAKGEDKSDAPSHTDGEMRAERGTVVTSRSNIKKSAPAPEEAPAPEKKRRGRPPGQKSAKAAESAASRSEKPPIDRRAIMEKARAARMAKIAAVKAGSSPAAAKPAAADKAAAKAEKAAARQAKAAAKAADKANKPPIDRRAIMEKARAARMANLAAAGKLKPQSAKPAAADKAAAKAEKAAARQAKEAAKAADKANKPPVDRRALMEKARAARMANLAAAGKLKTPPTPPEAQAKPAVKSGGGNKPKRGGSKVAADDNAVQPKAAGKASTKKKTTN